MLPTHPPWFSLHIPGLECFSIIHDNSHIIYIICEVLDWLGKFFSHLWWTIIFSEFIFLSLMSCLLCHSILPMRDVLFMYAIIHHYSMEGYTPIFISSFMWFSLYYSLYFPVYACENYLSRKIYFMCFFLAYLFIALKILFLHGIIAQGCSISIDLRSYIFSPSKHI